MRRSRFWTDKDHENTIYSMRMHQHLSFFMKKNGQEWPFFGQRLSLAAPDKHSKTPPPILRVLDAKKQVVRAHRRQKHNLQHLYVPKRPIFHEKSAKNGRFLVKN